MNNGPIVIRQETTTPGVYTASAVAGYAAAKHHLNSLPEHQRLAQTWPVWRLLRAALFLTGVYMTALTAHEFFFGVA